MGRFGNLLKGRMKDPIRGNAQVVSCSAHRGDGTWENCEMHLVVQGEGVPATPVEHECMVRADRWPSPGVSLPVKIDRADPERIKIEWDEVESSRDAGARSAEALAAALRGQGGAAPPGGVGAGGVNVVNLSGGDLSQLSDEQKAKLQMLGIDPAMIAAQQGATAAPDDEVDEHLARLTKLGQLRDAGVLTPQEFEEQKRRILEG